MTTTPIQLSDLDVVGFADVLPGGRGPALLPPVFRHRAESDRCYVPPFRIAGNWLLDAQSVSFTELEDLQREESVTLPEGFCLSAAPDCQLWVDQHGAIHYELSSEARRKLDRVHAEHLQCAILALHEGKFEEARRSAGVALAANDRAVEPRALIAALHALCGETSQAAFIQTSAEQAGANGESFVLLLKHYLESIPPEIWEKNECNVEGVLKTCDELGVGVLIPFNLAEADFRRLEPILHTYSRGGDEHHLIISCPGVEAILMSERDALLVAYHDAELHIAREHRTNVLAVAAETMLYEPHEIATQCGRDSGRVEHLGGILRERVRPLVL